MNETTKLPENPYELAALLATTPRGERASVGDRLTIQLGSFDRAGQLYDAAMRAVHAVESGE